MKKIADTYGFTLLMSSPHYPQSNRLAEHTIQTIKELLQDSPDPYLALVSFKTTPILWCSFSPAELLMGRQLRTAITTPKNQLIPQWSYLQKFREKDNNYKAKQRRHYNDKHRVRPQDPLLPDTSVWIKTEWSPSNWSHPILSKYIQILHCHHYRWPRAKKNSTMPYTQVTNTDTFPVWSFSEATRPIDTVTQTCKKGRCGVTKY